MSVQSKPYYWLVCDHPGCNRKSTEGGEFTAWSDRNGAEEDAGNSDWQIGWRDGVTATGYDFCWEHVRVEEESTE